MTTKRPTPRHKRPTNYASTVTATTAVLTKPAQAEVCQRIDAIDPKAETLLYGVFDGDHIDAEILAFYQIGDVFGLIRGLYIIYAANEETATGTVEFRTMERVGEELKTEVSMYITLHHDAEVRQEQISGIIKTFQWANELR